MDVGTFKSSSARLVAWIVVPPLLITAVGLSSMAMRQRAQWRLEEANALSDVLPEVMHARKNVQTLYDNLGLSGGKRIATGDQLIALLEEKARKWDIALKRTQIMDDVRRRDNRIPIVSAMMEGSGNIADFQHFLNDVKTAHPMVSTRVINLEQGSENQETEGFELRVVFDLLLVRDVLKASGD